jgi:hypothetical protein
VITGLKNAALMPFLAKDRGIQATAGVCGSSCCALALPATTQQLQHLCGIKKH